MRTAAFSAIAFLAATVAIQLLPASPPVVAAQSPSPAPPAPAVMPIVNVEYPAAPVAVGSVVHLDARASVVSGALSWIPQRSTVLAESMTLYDQGDRKACSAVFTGLPEGDYQIAVVGYGSAPSGERPPVSVQVISWKMVRPSAPAPAPSPAPSPGPAPTPTPSPSARVDDGVAKAAAAYWKFYLDAYGNWDTKAKDYNAEANRLLDSRKSLGLTLGKEIDRLVLGQVGTDGKFKDPVKAREAMQIVRDSIRSGMIRALAP